MAGKVLTEADFPFPTEKAMRLEHDQQIKRIAREDRCPRAFTVAYGEDQMTKTQTTTATTKLARGVDAQNSPQSAKAVADNRAKNAAAAKGAAPAKAAKTAAKAERKAKSEAVNTDSTKITILNKDFTFGREGSGRNLSWIAAKKAKTVGAYIAAGGARKYLARWQSAGAIKLG